MEDKSKLRGILEKLRYPILVFVLGLALMLLPNFSSQEKDVQTPEEKLQTLLSETRGVGNCLVLISENGVAVVCDGAEDPQVHLDILRAVASYTGFGSDKITVLKRTDQSKGRNG